MNTFHTTSRRLFLLLISITILSCYTTVAWAQCSVQNTAFSSGEVLNYKMYFNWKFIWVNAGTATMSTKETQWQGKNAYKSNLITKSSAKIDKYFMLRDTLESVMTTDLAPLYYKKSANEGNKYYRDKVWYSYNGGKIHMKHEFQNRKGEISSKTSESTKCTYDMMSMMQRARSLDASGMKKGDKMKFPMADGKGVDDITLIYRGKENFKMKSTGITYRCLIFSLMEADKSGSNKEIIKFYITDDDNHVPVRLDMFLRFGTAKVYLSEAKGLRHECTSIVKGQ